MLDRLEVSNLGPITQVDLALGAGLVAVTGESGAGKSLLLRAIEVAVGGRADGHWVRHGAELMTIRLTLRDPDGRVRQVERHVRADGRSRARLDGRGVAVSALRALGEAHLGGGRQGDVYRLREEGARSWLDQAPGVQEVRASVAEAARRYASLREEARTLGPVSDVERIRRVETLSATIAEIDQAKLRPGEADELRSELRRLEGIESLIRSVAEAREILTPEGEGEGARDLIARAVGALTEGARIAKDLEEARTALESVQDRLQELSRDLEHSLGRLEPDPVREAEVRERLSRLGALLRRYGPSEVDALQVRRAAAEELGHLETTEVRAQAVERELREAEAHFRREASVLSKVRRDAARLLETRVREGLMALMLPDSAFAIEVDTDASAPVHPDGLDRVRLLFAAQAEAGLRPLEEVASGGEAARVLLALEGALAEAGEARTWVFDEVEAGVGGEAAWAVADALHRLARGRQVLVVTHQAAVAARADQHIEVRKVRSDGGFAQSSARALETDEERRAELARMLSGGGREAVLHAGALLERAAAARNLTA